jgi:hypothetical protein
VPLDVFPNGTPLLQAGRGRSRRVQEPDGPPEATRVINGYRVQVGATAKDQWPTSALCASHAGGVFAWIATGSHSAISPAGLFAHHLRLLGPDPANWTSKLIS